MSNDGVPDASGNSPAISPSSSPSLLASRSVAVDIVRILATTAGAVVLCVLNKIPPEAALVAIAGTGLPADLPAIARALLAKVAGK